MSAIGSAIAITWAKFGLKIEKTIENQDMLEIYISVPERSFHQNASGEEMSGMTLAKMGVKRLTVKSRIRIGEVWTKELSDEAELNMRKQLFGSQY